MNKKSLVDSKRNNIRTLHKPLPLYSIYAFLCGEGMSKAL